MSYLLGIDLGASRTIAAVGRPDRPDAPEVVALGERSMDAPTVLFLGEDGTVTAGESAQDRAAAEPDRAVREFTERIGSPEPIVVAGVTWPAEELCARMVRWVVNEVAEQEGGPADAVAIARPASWTTHQQDLLAGALGGHGMAVTFVGGVQATGAVRVLAGGAEPYAPTTVTPVFDESGYEPPPAYEPPAQPGYEQQYPPAPRPDELRTSRLAVPPPEASPAWAHAGEQEPVGSDVEYAPEEERRPALGRTPATMVGIGGALGALALVGTIVFWPSNRVTNTASVITPATTTSAPAPAPTAENVAPSAAEAPAPPPRTTRRTPVAPTTTTEVLPPPVEPTAPRTTTTTTPPSSDAPPPTSSEAPPSEPPDKPPVP
ncbi:hypothetical protein [Pseudonocardia sp. T1-2H]|uniref:hypothetical protein n=1 Tax=Pseudonocardia sp. T1-2H TaxID=3128899 RepID=UPI003101602A